MGEFGMPMEQLYMYTLLAAGALTVLCVFFGEVTEFKGTWPIFNPIVILAFFTFGSAIGFLLETATEFNEWSVLVMVVLAAAILDLLLYFVILLPVSSASTIHSEESLPGQLAKVVIPIPGGGCGEVVIETYSGVISKSATGYNNEAIAKDEKVMIVEVSEDIVYVKVCAS
ncbi:putative membrane protein [Planococcus halocryophilus Or1]|uniref:Membrane protein NfeD2 N-terminal transmembrane domain-containing protein n=1 Tax=Planococcus halocryophilus TaxID=1215089 RepID=A0A1C7DUQ4_9BACL|nr:hypothetical protein [Planococcus halocryophilus]ANU15011.1 hypothetical protein BBI08_14620 [Planococcus halocryophilus]EMF45692.1 putative membrane protein [Planococcus halocryophilus Or1]